MDKKLYDWYREKQKEEKFGRKLIAPLDEINVYKALENKNGVISSRREN